MTAPGRIVGRLKKRRDFLAAARGLRAGRGAMLVECRPREDDGPPRFGFTVSKKTAAKAVVRNRIRRRLKEAVRLGGADAAFPGWDYVLIGRPAALTRPFSALQADLASALVEASRKGSAQALARRGEER